MQLMDKHIEALANIYRVQKSKGKDLNILLVDYSLTSLGHYYPQQINESINIYDKLVDEGYTNIIIVGDSAGGNLVINNLIALLKRDTHVTWPIGAIAISPYLNVSNQGYDGSVKRFNGVDFFSSTLANHLGKGYIQNDESLNDSVEVNIEHNADKVNWDSIPLISEGKFLLLFGDNEILSDEILRFAEKSKLKQTHPERIAIDIDGIHVGFFVSETLDYNNDLNKWKNEFCAKTLLDFIDEITQ